LASPREEVGKIFLAWYDLVPLISFLWLRGKCRSCRKKISWQYPLVELATGSLFVAVYQSTGSSICYFLNFSGHCLLFTAYCLFIISSLIVIFVYDLRHYIIPDKIIFPAIGAAFLWQVFLSLEIGHWSLLAPSAVEGVIGHFWSFSLSALGAATFFLALVFITRGRGMGLGDVKLVFLMGLVLGWPDILAALFLAFFGGALVGTFLILGPPASAWLRRVLNFLSKNSSSATPIFGKNWKKTLRSEIPFGPFLVVATLLIMLAGKSIVGWYFNLFGF